VTTKRAQSLETKQAEVEFRRLDRHDPRGATSGGPQGDGPDDLEALLRQRIDKTRGAIADLGRRGIPTSPFLEIGAERCQRSLVLANEFGCEGIAADISLESLLVAPRISEMMGYAVMPTRVCCDGNLLPVASGSLAFTFCYEVLHHFSDPRPLVEELQRVLRCDGVFLFDEEPGRGWARIPLVERDDRSPSATQRLLARLHLLPFLSRPGGDEVRHGVTEGEFLAKEWPAILRGFDLSEVRVETRLDRDATLEDVLSWRGPKRWWIAARGADVHGHCRLRPPEGSAPEKDPATSSAGTLLVCPQCLSDRAQEHVLDAAAGGLSCPACETPYPCIHGVHLLFTRETGRALYPEYFD
jgi:SAM-dependent methyltransferase